MRKLTPNMVTRLAYAADLVNYAAVRDLPNVHRTEAALAARGLVDFTGPRPVVSADGWRALAAAGFVLDKVSAPAVAAAQLLAGQLAEIGATMEPGEKLLAIQLRTVTHYAIERENGIACQCGSASFTREGIAKGHQRSSRVVPGVVEVYAEPVAEVDEPVVEVSDEELAAEAPRPCEGGMWCRCGARTPCYPPAPVAVTWPARGLDELRDQEDDEPVDRAEFRRLLDDPAVWRRALVSMQAHGIEVDTKIVDELRRASGI